MKGGVFSPSFADPALLHLGLEALWDFARLVFTGSLLSPGHENVAKHRDRRGHLEAIGRHGRFQHALINIQIDARGSKTLRPSAPFAAKSRIWSRHASSRLSRPSQIGRAHV